MNSLVAFLIPISVITLSQAPTAKTNLIRFDKGVHNFGFLQLGLPASCSFTITNTSKNNITVDKTWAGCGCTTPKISRNTIGPGQQAKLTVTYNAGAEEVFLKEVYIKLKESDNIYVLRVKGQV
ncbi:DUF1573 domain-containing protein, partial [Candidatus Dependentiae bacterium]|nr:DUF1573 domain-containing protein [Candidatus Dependentiae bacterium]